MINEIKGANHKIYTLLGKGCLQKKKSSYGGKLAIKGGRGSNQIPTNFSKKVGKYYQGRGGPKDNFVFPF